MRITFCTWVVSKIGPIFAREHRDGNERRRYAAEHDCYTATIGRSYTIVALTVPNHARLQNISSKQTPYFGYFLQETLCIHMHMYTYTYMYMHVYVYV